VLDVRLQRARRRRHRLRARPLMGPSVRMIEKRYGRLLEGAQGGLAQQLDRLEAELAVG
jgi:hypothetical protein